MQSRFVIHIILWPLYRDTYCIMTLLAIHSPTVHIRIYIHKKCKELKYFWYFIYLYETVVYCIFRMNCIFSYFYKFYIYIFFYTHTHTQTECIMYYMKWYVLHEKQLNIYVYSFIETHICIANPNMLKYK